MKLSKTFLWLVISLSSAQWKRMPQLPKSKDERMNLESDQIGIGTKLSILSIIPMAVVFILVSVCLAIHISHAAAILRAPELTMINDPFDNNLVIHVIPALPAPPPVLALLPPPPPPNRPMAHPMANIPMEFFIQVGPAVLERCVVVHRCRNGRIWTRRLNRDRRDNVNNGWASDSDST